MSKILISWIATVNDFTNGSLPINENGPNISVHKHYWNYEYHLLLSQQKKAEEDIRAIQLSSFITQNFNHEVKIKALSINDIIDVSEISQKINALLIDYKDDEIDIFISPGTPAMQVVWYLSTLNNKTSLFQLRKIEHSNNKEKPEKVDVIINKSKIPTTLLISERRKKTNEKDDFIITKSIESVYELALKVAHAEKTTVLIFGETGTGKEALAKYIHNNSSRKKSKFITINCSAFDDTLLESRLFGYKKHSHNMAFEDTPGLFEAADSGTIFLDEIGDISKFMQQSLLRVIQEGEILRIGENVPKKINVRIFAATNKNLIDLCRKGDFRWDLYYRLSVVELTLSPLRYWNKNDIEQLFNHIVEKKIKDFNSPPIFSENIKEIIFNYQFPGNIREMDNLIEKLFAIVEEKVELNDLPYNIQYGSDNLSLKLKDVIYNHINKVYNSNGENISLTARTLDVSINTVRSHLKLNVNK